MDEKITRDLRAKHHAATFRTSLIPTYNCHGLTFASRRTSINDVEAVQTIITDDAYDEISVTEVLAGDMVIYVSPSDGDIEHSGVVAGVVRGPGTVVTPWVYSKWGKGPEVLHAWHDCSYTLNVKYYRIRS